MGKDIKLILIFFFACYGLITCLLLDYINAVANINHLEGHIWPTGINCAALIARIVIIISKWQFICRLNG
ncbi:hypothetical protein XELAEV_18024689mg [Xenopus laevis]|uniref:Uncharacterized protein n=1 Tax=Xenopus laevis TaxID=8355 RepID=A0A974CZD4_XENLA|nr:hypothetical protein XELAEV_18024689mg [Xenopus laevis]